MIVESDFLSHWKTQYLSALLDDDRAPLYMLSIWLHLFQRKTDEMPNLPHVVAAVAQYRGEDKDRFVSALLEARFMYVEGDKLIANDFRAVNAKAFANWENGPKGGRPKNPTSSNEKPNDNPTVTHSGTHTKPVGWLVGSVGGLDKNPPLPPSPKKAPARKPRKDAAEETPEFQEFYSRYPKHVGRGAAFKAWKVAIKKTTIDRIMEALQKQIRAGLFIKDDPQYIMHPSTWLNGLHWDDDVPFAPAPPDTRPTRFRVQPIIDPETGEELEPVRTLEYPTFEAMEAAMKTMQVDRKDDVAGYWLFTEAGYAHQVEAAKRKRGMFSGLLMKI